MDRADGMENAHDALAAECIRVTGVSHTALDGKERRPHAPQARSLYSRTGPQGTSQVEFQVPVANRLGGTDRSTSLRSDERSTSPEFVFHIPECVFHFTEIRTCRSCNSSKGSKDVFTWAESKGFFPLEIGKRYIRLAWLWSSRMGLLDAPLDELRAADPPFLLDIPWTDDLPRRRPQRSETVRALGTAGTLTSS